MDFLKTNNMKSLSLAINIVLSVAYFVCIALVFPAGNPVLFGFLVAGEVFHLWQVMGYVHSVWPRHRLYQFSNRFRPKVAIFITVCGEPKEIVAETVIAAKAMKYPRFSIYILNDGLVAKRDNWKEAEEIAKTNGIKCITRKTPGGAKAGNINHAMSKTKEKFIVIFDADHVPKKRFLSAMMGYFVDDRVAFVQSPQYYKNHAQNVITGGAWEQQALFFGALGRGKDRSNTMFMCGTNMIMRRTALAEAGGMSEFSIAEDFLTSLLIHEKGWKSVYVPEVLAEGLAPEDFLSYYKQQHRWARGSLEVVFKYNPLFRRGLTWSQRLQYLASASFYLSGVVVFINAMLPIVFFYTGQSPLQISTMTLALIFIPYLFFVLYTVQMSSNFSYTFRALAFTLSSWPIHLKAVFQILTGRKSGFAVTSKRKLSGNYTYLAMPHITYIVLVAVGIIVAVYRSGLTAAVLTNTAWALIYIAVFLPFILAAASRNEAEAVAPADTAADDTPDLPGEYEMPALSQIGRQAGIVRQSRSGRGEVFRNPKCSAEI
jgi:cellulose synthase (UDP-forming)